MSSGRQSGQIQGLQDAEPELPGEHTRIEDMLGSFIFLVAEGNDLDVEVLFFCKRSAVVQQRLRIASQTKVLHF